MTVCRGEKGLCGGLVACRVVFARASVIGLCFFVSVIRVKQYFKSETIPDPLRSRYIRMCGWGPQRRRRDPSAPSVG